MILVDGVLAFESDGRHLLAIGKAKPGKPFVYYFGAGWSKSGDFANDEASHFSQRLASPHKVTIGRQSEPRLLLDQQGISGDQQSIPEVHENTTGYGRPAGLGVGTDTWRGVAPIRGTGNPKGPFGLDRKQMANAMLLAALFRDCRVAAASA